MSKASALTVDLILTLGYRHGFGALSPFFHNLRDGRALGSRCPVCGDVRFAPRRFCMHDGAATEPHHPNGIGHIIRTTTGSVPIPLSQPAQDRIFAEVAMDGADNRVLARLLGDAAMLQPGAWVRLATPAATPPHPIQALVFVPLEGSAP